MIYDNHVLSLVRNLALGQRHSPNPKRYCLCHRLLRHPRLGFTESSQSGAGNIEGAESRSPYAKHRKDFCNVAPFV